MQAQQQWNDYMAEALVRQGFTNIRHLETEKEHIVTFENTVYSIQAVGIQKALEIIGNAQPQDGKPCKVIVTYMDIPQLTITSHDVDTTGYAMGNAREWSTSNHIDEAWDLVKKTKKTNSGFLDVDLIVYPQIYYKSVITTQIYQALFELNPALEVTLWEGAKFIGQVAIPIYNDGYPGCYKNIRWGKVTLEQNFRLLHHVQGKVNAGIFDNNCFGGLLSLSAPLSDERFSLFAETGVVGIGYSDKLNKFYYNGTKCFVFSTGMDFYWPQYNIQFKAKGERYPSEKYGVQGEMIRHFKFASIGLYGMTVSGDETSGGFKLMVALPPYKSQRHKKWPRIDTSLGMGTTYNAKHQSQPYTLPSRHAGDNILYNNRFNPFFVKTYIK
ncbi:MAG: hypothetical protein Q4E55_02945 [Bacteroidales bacterium]|nr:hypothetical protein [Bacteroidales bacterium]